MQYQPFTANGEHDLRLCELDSTEVIRRPGLGKLQTIGELLLCAGPGWLGHCLREAADFQAQATPRQLLDDMIGDQRRRERLLEIVTGLDHLGFVAFQGAGCDLDSTADAAGFTGRHWLFPSRIVARELGHFTGTNIVPTSVFKARGTAATGQPMAVEVFLPQPLAAAVSRDWIERGCAVHAAFVITEPKCFPDVIEIMLDEGFCPPEFTRGEPLVNEVENMTLLYFDGTLRGQPLRIEFCHSL